MFAVYPLRAEVIIVGGQGFSWEGGGGDIPATVIRTARTVERTNAPGGVIDYKPLDRPNWIFPQRADTTRNIALGADSPERSGGITSPNTQRIRTDLPSIIDDDGATALDLRAAAGGQSARVLGILIDLDLGARFGVNRFKFFPRNADSAYPAPNFPFQNDFMRGFEVFVNDGTEETQREGVPILQTVAIQTQNTESVVDILIPPQYVRFIRLKSLTAAGFEIAEFQVFGTGYVPEARYVSNVFDFGDLALLGRLRWTADQVGDPKLSKIQVRTRTGLDPQPVEFNKIRPGERIFRVGGGAGTSNQGTNTAGLQVPWKRAEDVSDAALSGLVVSVLDNDEVDVRDALEQFKALTVDQRNIVTLDQSDYTKLRNEDKGDVRDDVTNWVGWSPPYDAAASQVAPEQIADPALGVQVVADEPRRYFQFAVDFSSEEFESAAGMGSLAFEVLTPPFAEELIGEISPRIAAVGERTRFTYAVRNKSRPGKDRGFDRLAIDTPLRAEAVGRIQIRRPDGRMEEADFSGDSLERLPLVRGSFSVLEVGDQQLAIGFPAVDESGTVVSVEFDNGVLRYGTTFSGRTRSSQGGSAIGQDVMAGNAAELSVAGHPDSDVQPLGTPRVGNLSVEVPIARNLLINVEAVPLVFTPNGDGINDQAAIHYDITNIVRPSPVEIRICDLSGRLVRHLYAAADLSGRFARPWDGRNDDGEQVPPGTYLYTVDLKAGTGSQRQLGAVGVAY
ncbi:MAG: hypothetical protein EXS58_14470 [Candidatus Latescibacteria bacterium]|nr:hypothetical protein [Candidatus Latescibacterota bacterium]